jgi:excisionase family DNA binding protein
MVQVSTHKDTERAEMVDAKTICKRMSWTRSTLMSMVDRGLPYYRPGKKLYFNMNEVQGWMQQFAHGRRF